MKYRLINPAFHIDNPTDIFCTTVEDVINVLEEDFFWDVIHSSFDAVEVRPMGVFEESEIEAFFRAQSEIYIRSLDVQLQFISEQVSDSGEVIEFRSISLVEYVFKMFEDAFCDSSIWGGSESISKPVWISFVKKHHGMSVRSTRQAKWLIFVKVFQKKSIFRIHAYGLDCSNMDRSLPG